MFQQKRRQSTNMNQQKDDMQSVILDLARVTRVQRGGKRLRFRVCVGIGDRKGTVGVGIAKGSDVSIAVEKASRQAKKNTIQVPITESGSIPHPITIKHKAAHILFKPAPAGTGIKAGGVIRVLCDLAGLQNISAKILGTNNKVNNARAAIKAFQQFKI
jgi:small subunit ribosomal protein S5